MDIDRRFIGLWFIVQILPAGCQPDLFIGHGVNQFMDGFFEGFTGFLLAIVFFMAVVQIIIVKPGPVVDKIFSGIEKYLLALKLPKFLVGIIMYVVLWIPLGIALYTGA